VEHQAAFDPVPEFHHGWFGDDPDLNTFWISTPQSQTLFRCHLSSKMKHIRAIYVNA
jgi:hypothetical protein